jgi:hypothetical protein
MKEAVVSTAAAKPIHSGFMRGFYGSGGRGWVRPDAFANALNVHSPGQTRSRSERRDYDADHHLNGDR